MENLHLDQSALLKAIIVLGVFLLMTAVLLAAKRLLLRWIGGFASPNRTWVDSLLPALSPALSIAAVVVAFGTSLNLEPIPAEIHSSANALITAGAILAMVVFFDGLLAFWMKHEAVRFPMLSDSYALITTLVRGAVFGLGALMFLESIGISIGPILATLGIGSLAIALALQQTVRNTLSGFFVMIDKPVTVGDYVKLSTGQEGWLTQLGWRSSKFTMLNDNVVVVPNSLLVDAILTNLRSIDGALSVEMDFNVAGDSDLEKVEHVTQQVAAEAMKNAERNGANFTPSVYFQAVSASAFQVAVFLRVSHSSIIEQVKHDFVKRLTQRYRQENIKLS